MADPNSRDRCDKCGAISKQSGIIRNFYHYIYDEKLGKTDKVKTSRLAGEGELLFCSKPRASFFNWGEWISYVSVSSKISPVLLFPDSPQKWV